MKIIGLSGSIVGSKTKTAMKAIEKLFNDNYSDIEFELIDLADYEIIFADGRHYQDYEGDTQSVVTKIMDADALVIGTPIFQASIPATLKNIFDLLPEEALKDKIVSMVVTAGSPAHFMVPEIQLKPVLSYLKAQILQRYLFITDKHFYRGELMDDAIYFRMQNLVDDTILLAQTYQEMRNKQEAQFDF